MFLRECDLDERFALSRTSFNNNNNKIDGKVGDTPGAVKQINCVLLALNSNL